jgi:hypothetical protein
VLNRENARGLVKGLAPSDLGGAMRVRITEGVVAGGAARAVGEELELPKDEAEIIIRLNRAVSLDPPEPDPEVGPETATAEAPENAMKPAPRARKRG